MELLDRRRTCEEIKRIKSKRKKIHIYLDFEIYNMISFEKKKLIFGNESNKKRRRVGA
jgi:hypothetical protein